MQTLIQFLGFTTLTSSAWNAVAYIAFIGIIIGVSSERYRNLLFTVGAFVLALYASIFLHNQLFATLQMVIVVSGFLQLLKFSDSRFSIGLLSLFTLASYLNLTLNGVVSEIWSFIGSLGLLGIAFGLVVLPKRFGFLIMTMGGIFLVIYAFTVSAWVFFFLNIFFAIVNIKTWHKNK